MKTQLKTPQKTNKPVFMYWVFEQFSNHLKGFRKGLRPVPQTFSMIFKNFSKTAHKPLANRLELNKFKNR